MNAWRANVNAAIEHTEAALVCILKAGPLPVEMAGTLSRAWDDIREATDGLRRFLRKLDAQEQAESAVDPFLPLTPEDGELTPLLTRSVPAETAT